MKKVLKLSSLAIVLMALLTLTACAPKADKAKEKMEKAKKEKLVGTKNNVRTMQESVLRDRVTAFLDAHPEFCDEFSE